MVSRDGAPYALFYASCYDHGDVRESWIDVVFGTWGEGAEYHDHLTFGCRFGPVANSDQPSATAVNAAFAAPDNVLFGQKLTRDVALQHPRLAEFWQIVDFVVATDPLVHAHHYGHRPTFASPAKRGWRNLLSMGRWRE